MTEKELQDLIDLMRRNAVDSLKCNGVEIHLLYQRDLPHHDFHAGQLSPPPTPATNPRFDLPPIDYDPPKGEDGLTVEQQIDLYGRPMDSFDPKKRQET